MGFLDVNVLWKKSSVPSFMKSLWHTAQIIKIEFHDQDSLILTSYTLHSLISWSAGVPGDMTGVEVL